MPDQTNDHAHQGHEHHHHDYQSPSSAGPSTPMPAPMMQNALPVSKPKRDWTPLYTPFAIIVAGLLVALGLFLGLSHSGAATATGTGNGTQGAAAPSVDIANVKTTNEPYVGQANAPVVMAFWSDYQCPYCRAWEVGGVSGIPGAAVLPQLITQYVDTGKLKIVFKDFQFLGPDSITDGEWARAVWALYPGQFLAWRTAIYTDEPQENSLTAAQNLARLRQVTGSIPGINAASVEANVTKNQAAYDAAMTADEQEGAANGIQGTPGFIVGKTLISGDEPLAQFTGAIDAELK